MSESPVRLSIFPLAGAILLPRAQLPLHIFEPRYRALVQDSMARDRRIAMIQPRSQEDADGHKPALFDIGCIGKISEVEAMEDGRFNLVLDGLTRFRVVRELDVTTAFRQVEAVFPSEQGRAELSRWRQVRTRLSPCSWLPSATPVTTSCSSSTS